MVTRQSHRLTQRALLVMALASTALVTPAAAEVAGECPPRIRVAYTDSELPPYVLGTGAGFREPPGLFVVWARAALRKLGCTEVVAESRLPYHRIVSNMAAGEIDIRVTGAYRSDVAEIMRFPMRGDTVSRAMAVAEADTRLYVLKAAPGLEWDGRQPRFTGPNPAVGTVRGHYTESVVRARQWVYDSAPTWEANARKLLAGRVAAIVGPDSVVDALQGREQMQMLEPPVQYDLYFAPVSRPFFEQYPEFTRRFWLEICRESRATFVRLPTCSLH